MQTQPCPQSCKTFADHTPHPLVLVKFLLTFVLSSELRDIPEHAVTLTLQSCCLTGEAKFQESLTSVNNKLSSDLKSCKTSHLSHLSLLQRNCSADFLLVMNAVEPFYFKGFLCLFHLCINKGKQVLVCHLPF